MSFCTRSYQVIFQKYTALCVTEVIFRHQNNMIIEFVPPNVNQHKLFC